jgi:hypothetical protein
MRRKKPTTKASKPAESTFDSVAYTATLPWNKPLCSHCGKPIEKSSHAYAGWLHDEHRRTHSPVVVHSGAHCPYYPERHAPAEINDLPVDVFRRSPMDAISIALQRRGDTKPERVVWAVWLSVVLGLPFNREREFVLDLRAHGEVAKSLPTRVFTVEELKRAEEEQAR